MRLNHHIVDLSQVFKTDEDLVGKKAQELGMLWKLGIPLPKGFVITINFFKEFLRLIDIDKNIYKTPFLKHPALSNSTDNLLQRHIMHSHIPQILVSELHNYYKNLSGLFKNRPLNIFSSSSDNKSIVFTNIKGDTNLILKIKTIWASSFKNPVAIVVQEEIKAGVKGKIVTGNPVFDKRLTKVQMDKLNDYCKIIQKHSYFPKEIEYIVIKDKIIITKVNPFTGIVNKFDNKATSYKTPKIIAKGVSINPGIVTGRVKILNNFNYDPKIKNGDVIVLHNLDHSLFGMMKNAKAVVVDSFLPNSYEKFLYRKDFHIPTVEGVKNATRVFQNGNIVTVNGVSGEIYSGGLIY
ncbi:MAG: hypothetical protein A3B47_02200 [Candidatus Levybacteria bacterium RIFCSPLOWO2_01_FULL_39_24]|nr:MAG: hypothetical protein A2800_01495 [Candidatus Levybacteria bacterium RIFCSPHIGHO2_01_FULL_40_16]OGH28688.1 MAG: hypothetical protein A3E12_00150 [Candidatus Levybacteria bacterium RIFCSPHIGHO2_12_FULL_39_9]OGH46451.1 MAG: hypothetical protein A3B47_02200 [Candidatus Levybacteria bacterium RIFCSPLOWO2_01_FULL_39_24]